MPRFMSRKKEAPTPAGVASSDLELVRARGG
jgi:hypothetical protein